MTNEPNVTVEIRIEFLGKSLRGRLFQGRFGDVEFVETDADGMPVEGGARLEVTKALFDRYRKKIATELPILPQASSGGSPPT
jgi:hypothetical protein